MRFKMAFSFKLFPALLDGIAVGKITDMVECVSFSSLHPPQVVRQKA